jgi:stringent starvation protein B
VTQLEIGNEVIAFNARFGGVGRAVSVPIAAVQAIYARENGQGMLLAENAPGAAPAVGLADATPDVASAEPSKPPLQVVQAPAQDPPAPTDDGSVSPDGDDTPDRPRPKGKPSLHVVR